MFRLKYIWTMLLLIAALQAAGDPYVIDKVCLGAERVYRVDGEPGSEYLWLLTDSEGTQVVLPDPDGTLFSGTDPISGVTKQGSEIILSWNTVGNFDLASVQTSIHGCDTTEQGQIQVFPHPLAFAGNPATICPGNTFTLSEATATNYGTLSWISPGDGTFEDASILNPVYTPGPADLISGKITLTFTAGGLGNGTTCIAAVSTVELSILRLEAFVSPTNVTCYGAKNGTISIDNPLGGSGNYEYTIDGTSWSATMDYTGLAPGEYTVQMRDMLPPLCVANLGTFTIIEPDPLTATTRKTDASCLGNDGVIAITDLAGGSKSYEFSLDGNNWRTSGYFDRLAPGSYDVWVGDANVEDCKVMVETVIIIQPKPVIAKVVSTNVMCFGVSDGTILITEPENGSEVYEFSIDGATWIAEAKLPFSNLSAGNYKVLMRDFNANFCIETIADITITEPEKLATTPDLHHVTCFGGNDGSITMLNSKGGSGSYEFTIDGTNWVKTLSVTGLTAGKYDLQMRDAATPTCIEFIGELIITEPLQLTALVTPEDITCYGAKNGIITITDPKNGLPDYEYTIDGTIWTKNSTFTGLGPATYEVQMRDANGCTEPLGSFVIVEPEPLTATVDFTHETCLGNDGTIAITEPLNSVSGLYEYMIDGKTWTDSGIFTGLAANTYIVFIRDKNLVTCERTIATVVITEPEPLLATAATTDVTCFGGSDGTITVDGMKGGSGVYEYSIDGTVWTASTVFTSLKRDNYTILMRDAQANECLFTVGVFAIDEPDLLMATVVPVDVSCFGRSDGKISIANPTGGSGNYEYSRDGIAWNDGNFEDLAIGSYTISMRDADAKNCMVTLNPVTINQPDKLTASIKTTDVSCFGGKDGTIKITNPLNGTPPYSYSLDGGTTWHSVNIFSGLEANVYTLMMIQDANSCTATLQPVEIAQPEKLEAIVTRSNETSPDANNGAITISGQKGGSGNYEYSIDGGTNWQFIPEFTGLAPGDYIVWVSDANADDCMFSLPVNILPAGSILANYIFTPVTCYGGNDGSITFIDPSGANMYEFSIDGGDKWQSSPVFTELTAQNYLLMVRNAESVINKTEIGNFQLNQPALLSATVTATSETFAGAGNGAIAISLPKGGSGDYEYSSDGTNWGNAMLFPNLTSGTYTIGIRDKNAPGCKISIPKTIQPAGSLSADVVATNIMCSPKNGGINDGSIVFSNASGATDFDYSVDDGAIWQPTGIFNGLATGAYKTKIRDRGNQANVVALDVITITEPKELKAYLSPKVPLCAGTSGTVTVFADGGTGIITGTGKYSMAAGESRIFTVTDENGCTYNTPPFTMFAPTKIEATAVVTPPKCFGEDGTVTITATGGTGTYTGLGTFTVRHGRSYSFIVTDSNGCISNRISGLMPDPKELVATAVPTDALCFGDMGSVTVAATGGTLPYFGTGTFDVLAGTYNYTITDANGCETVVSATVKEPSAIEMPVASVTFQPTCLQPKGTIVFTTPVEGTGYQYSVDDGITYSDKATFTDLPPGIYKLKVNVTATNCQSTPAILLTIDPPQTLSILPTASVTRQPDCYNPTGTIEVTSPAAGTGYAYSVNGGTTYFATRTFTGLDPGNYSVKIKDIATGCESVETLLTINPIPPAPAAPTVSVIQPTCLVPSGTITVTAPLGAAFEYSINGTDYQAGPVFANLTPGNYSVTVKDIVTGCVSLATVRIINPVPDIPEAPVSRGDLAECAKSPIQTLNANTAIVPVTGVRITWFDNATGGNIVASPTHRIVGTRTYYAEASNGVCVSLARTPVTLTISPIPAVPVAMVTVSPTCNNPDGTVVVTSPLGAEYVYSINGGAYQASVSFTGLVWGDHIIRAKNINTGCESAPGEIKVPAIPPAPELKLVSFENPICYGDLFTISLSMTNTPDGVYNFIYDGGQFSNVTVSGETATITGQFTENFKVFNNLRFTANDCNSTGTVNVRIVNPAQLDVRIVKVTEQSLKGIQRGAIDISATGGTGKLTYAWSNLATTQDLSDISFGDYKVTVTDDKNCIKILNIKVPLNNPPVAIDDNYRFTCLALLEDLLINDYDPDSIEQNDFITINTVPVIKPLHAQAFRINRDGTFEYLAVPGFNGIDFFVYEIADKHGQTSTAKVTITVVSDLDGDGIADTDDPDADGDGILNIYEALPGQDWRTADADGDGMPNYLDIDADGDGIPDNIEAQGWADYIHPSNIDVNNNGVDDAYDKFQFTTEIVPIDTDGDGIPDFLDSDSDNDGVPDYIEGHDLNADGKPDRFAFGRDSDGDGLDDAYDTVLNECNALGNAVGSNAPMQDFDGDGIPDWRDDNDDDDGYLTKFEDLNADGDRSNDDLDYDGHPEYLDYGRDCDLFIPDAFSPNGDNIHDYFQLYCINHFPDAKMYIFDQLGNKLFEKTHYGNLDFWLSHDRAWWNGKPEFGPSKARNEVVPPGTYYYVLDLGNGEVKKSFVFISY